MGPPSLFLVQVVTMFAAKVVNSAPVNKSSLQGPPGASCSKAPTNNCNCHCNVFQDSRVTKAVNALEDKVDQLIELVNKTAPPGLSRSPAPPASAPVSSCKEQFDKDNNRVFSCDVTTSMLLFQNSGTAAMLVSPTNPPGIELYYHANVFFSFGGKTSLLITSSQSQVYELTFGSQKVPVYCHIGNFGCGDGGWTLVVKTDGTKRTFHYDSHLWSNVATYNLVAGQTGFDRQETKLPTYWKTPFSKLCLGMRIGQQLQFMAMNLTANSLFSLIADGNYRPTFLGRDTWKTLIGSRASLQRNCNREGFNPKSESKPGTYSRARIGIIANQKNNCNTCDSRIGFGTGGRSDDSNTCGNEAQISSSDNGSKTLKAMGYILVQ